MIRFMSWFYLFLAVIFIAYENVEITRFAFVGIFFSLAFIFQQLYQQDKTDKTIQAAILKTLDMMQNILRKRKRNDRDN